MRILAALALAGLVLVGAAQASAPAPRLWLASPTRVAGAGFQAKEKLVVTVAAGNASQAKNVRASSAGGFATVLNTAVAYDNCHSALISVTRANGKRILAKVGGGSKDCAPPRPGRD